MLTESEAKTEWLKVPVNTPVIFVGNNSVCVGKGCHMLFYNLKSSEQHIYSAYKYEAGEGVKCYAGHRHLPIFAFAEKLINPRIFIVSLVDFIKLQMIEDGAPEGYMTMTFSEQSYLITLSEVPVFELVIWNWRTAEKLLAVKTPINQPNQVLCCSANLHMPIVVVQYAEKQNDFMYWEIHSVFKQCMSLKHVVKLPNDVKIKSCLWSNEGNLFVLSIDANIYQVHSDFSVELVFENTATGSEDPCFTWYKGGFVMYLPNMDIKFLKKTSGTWSEEWNVTPVKIKNLLTCTAHTTVIGWSNRAEILELDLTKQCFVTLKSFHTTRSEFCLIHPICNYFASVCSHSSSCIKVLECLTGHEMGHLYIDGTILVIAANPVYPYVACGLEYGTMTLINCYKPARPCVLTTFCLNRQDITKIVFSEKGDIIATASLLQGLFFVIRGTPGETMNVLQFIDYRSQTLDITVTEDEKYINLYILTQTDKRLPISQRIVVKSLSKTSKRIKKKKYTSPNLKLTSLQIVNNVFYANIFNTKTVCILHFMKKNIHVLNEMHTGHYLPHFILGNDNDHIFTYGYDGLVIIRTKDFNNIAGAILPHHRYNGGVQNIVVDPFMRFVISYGFKSKELVCTKFLKKSVGDHVVKETAKHFVDMRFLFADYPPTIGFQPKELCNDEKQVGKKRHKTFLEVQKQNLEQEEGVECAKERKAIMDEFLVLKQEVITLLEQNLNGPELEQIDILEFYQHTILRQHKEEMNKKKCEWTVLYYKDLIRAQDEITHFMKKKFYDSMEYTGILIKGIFSNFGVASYSLLPGASKYMLHARMDEIFRQFENMLREGDSFRPWEPMPERLIQLKLNNPPVMKIKSESVRIKEVIEELDSVDVSSTELRLDSSSYPSNTVPQFIEPNKFLYQQDEIHAYTQIIVQLRLMEADHEVLKNVFNEQYNDMKQQKVRDMGVIIEKCNRLRFILSELGNHTIEIEDPPWHSSEYSENIITVKDSEIGISPYITPSEQAILDWQASEAERIRLLLLADDFRERALMKMMDGVLEVRWEDTLKRDIPKPKCMLERDPATFNEDDLRAVKDYEEKVIFLNSERQMYRNLLEAEYTKTAEQVREIIKKFNARCRDLLLYKVKIESARMQQGFVLQRLQYSGVVRRRIRESELKIIDDIKSNEEHLTRIQNKITEISDVIIECKNAGDALVAKDKLLERNLKRDFQDYSALIQEQAFKLYKYFD